MIDTKLKQLTQDLTGLELRIDNKYSTALHTIWDNRSNKITKQYISLNKKQINRIHYTLTMRGFENKDNNIKYIQVILHEIAHYKQMGNFDCPLSFNTEYIKNTKYYEKIADRYALRYYKRII